MEEKEVKTKPITELISHEGAPDTKTKDEWKRKIQAGEEIKPLLIIKEGNKFGVEDGKHRLEAYRELGITDIPVEEIEKPKVSTPAKTSIIKAPTKLMKSLVNKVFKSEYNFVETDKFWGTANVIVKTKMPEIAKEAVEKKNLNKKEVPQKDIDNLLEIPNEFKELNFVKQINLEEPFSTAKELLIGDHNNLPILNKTYYDFIATQVEFDKIMAGGETDRLLFIKGENDVVGITMPIRDFDMAKEKVKETINFGEVKKEKATFTEVNNVIQELPPKQKGAVSKYEKGEITTEELTKVLTNEKARSEEHTSELQSH